jgi:6-phosphogluconolactonase
MKLNGMGRGLKATAISLAVGLGMTACSRDYTLGYLYVTSATKTTSGEINAYAIDFQSGALQQLADSPIPSGGSNPVTLVAAPNGKTIYVLNHDSSSIGVFAVGTDGKLYGQSTPSVVLGANGIVGTFPTAASIDPTGNFLYVTFTYQSGFTTARPGPGGVAVFPISHSSDSATEGKLGAPLTNTTVGTTAANPLPYFPVGNNPSGIVVSPKGGFVYVVDQEKPSSGAPFGVLLAFTASTSTGALTPVSGPISGGFSVGTSPSSIAEDPAGLYLYVTDQATNQLYAFQSSASGAPTALNSSPYTTGQDPLNVKVDPRGQYVYVANFGSSTVSAYTITTGGALSGVAGGASVATGPNCVTIEPALGIYLYTSNNTDNSVSAAQLDPHTGSTKPVQGTQFSAQPLPTCAVAIANGAHATQLVN